MDKKKLLIVGVLILLSIISVIIFLIMRDNGGGENPSDGEVTKEFVEIYDSEAELNILRKAY